MNTTLHIAKIENIELLQVKTSRFTAKNDSITRRVVQQEQPDGSFEQRKSYKISRGTGEESLTVTVYVENGEKRQRLLQLLATKKQVSITDKYKGEMTVYIKTYTVTDADAHLNYSEVQLNLFVQEFSVPDTTPNYKRLLEDALPPLKEVVNTQVAELSQAIGNQEGSVIDGIARFADQRLASLAEAMQQAFAAREKVAGSFSAVRQRVSFFGGLVESAVQMVQLPQQMAGWVNGIGEQLFSNVEAIPRFEEAWEGVTQRNALFPTLNDRRRTVILQRDIGYRIANNAILQAEINTLSNGVFDTQDAFAAVAAAAAERTFLLGIPSADAAALTAKIKGFAITVKLPTLKKIKVFKKSPLLFHVFNEYGSHALYSKVSSLNNFTDNEHINGSITLIDQ